MKGLLKKEAPRAISAVAGDGVFEGYASLFGVVDLGRDIVEKGAFRRSLTRGARAVRMLWQHDPAQPVGAWLSIREDERGLKVRGRLNLAVARARELHALMRDGGLDGLSIGYRVVKSRANASGGRRLLDLDLWEVSLVTFPMLPGARVDQVKRAAPPLRAAWAANALSLAIAGHALERRYNPHQARDQLGRWTQGAGGRADEVWT